MEPRVKYESKLRAQSSLPPDTSVSHPLLFGWATAMTLKGKRSRCVSSLQGPTSAALSLCRSTQQFLWKKRICFSLSFVSNAAKPIDETVVIRTFYVFPQNSNHGHLFCLFAYHQSPGLKAFIHPNAKEWCTFDSTCASTTKLADKIYDYFLLWPNNITLWSGKHIFLWGAAPEFHSNKWVYYGHVGFSWTQMCPNKNPFKLSTWHFHLVTSEADAANSLGCFLMPPHAVCLVCTHFSYTWNRTQAPMIDIWVISAWLAFCSVETSWLLQPTCRQEH